MRFAILLLMFVISAATSMAAGSEPEKKPESGTLSKADSAKAWRKPAADRRRRIIFNNDGNEPVTIAKQPTREALLAARTAALKGTQVDSIFYCTVFGSFGVFNHHTKVGHVFTSKAGRYADNQGQALLDAGIDPLAVMVDFCKTNDIEVFWSMRMNDTHDGSDADYGPVMLRANPLKAEHPEYLLSSRDKPPKYGRWTAVDYGRREVRDLAFRFVEEVCKNYDIDGVELDFFRHPVLLKSVSRGEPASEAELAGITELMKRIRTMADEVGRKRGRPILIAVKAPDSVGYDRAIGLDIEKWMADDLIDLLIPGGYFQLSQWETSVALGKKHGVKVYASLDESRVKDVAARDMRSTNFAFRGRAANAWAAGVDGIYLFNHFDPHATLWRELGDAQGLTDLDKDYFASIRGAESAAGRNLPYQEFQVIETLNPGKSKTIAPGKSAAARIRVGETKERLKTANLTLRLQFQDAPATKQLAVKLNGVSLEKPVVNGRWLEYHAVADAIRGGDNRVEVAVFDKTSEIVKWTDLVLQVRDVKSHHAETKPAAPPFLLHRWHADRRANGCWMSTLDGRARIAFLFRPDTRGRHGRIEPAGFMRYDCW